MKPLAPADETALRLGAGVPCGDCHGRGEVGTRPGAPVGTGRPAGPCPACRGIGRRYLGRNAKSHARPSGMKGAMLPQATACGLWAPGVLMAAPNETPTCRACRKWRLPR